MFNAHRNYRVDMFIGKRVVDVLALAARPDEPRLAQNAQLVRDRRLRHAERRSNVADAKLAFVQNVKYLDPRAVAEYLEQLLKLVKHIVVG